ncbi:hypothetical protein GCM10022267_75710 [Lentzea roselyniae]|uniref:Excreted virulence factor EspC, type VII ESX diderm n=1 Tax=Lentzea roselyniae TaxID=531940 RepID=A0ABP7C2I7_9PSEU
MSKISVDVEGLLRGGVNLDRITSLADSISSDLLAAVEAYRYAGGSGNDEMGQTFGQGYLPGAQRAIEFINLLQRVVHEASEATLNTGKTFEDANNQAAAIADQQQ